MFSNRKKYISTQNAARQNQLQKRYFIFWRWLRWPSLTSRENVHPIRANLSGARPQAISRVRQQRNATLIINADVKMPSSAELLSRSRLWYAAVAAFILLALALTYTVSQWLRQFPIEQVQFIGSLHYVSQEQIKSAVDPLTDTGFFHVDLSAIQKALSQIPWVETAIVTRKWPATLQVSVVERVAIAVWNGEYLISKQGELFKPEKMTALPTSLPHLFGPLSQIWLITERYRVISQMLSQEHLTIKTFTLTPNLSWDMVLSNGIRLRVDRENTLVKMQNFLQLYARLKPISHTIAEVDLRYKKGMAVGWKKMP